MSELLWFGDSVVLLSVLHGRREECTEAEVSLCWNLENPMTKNLGLSTRLP